MIKKVCLLNIRHSSLIEEAAICSQNYAYKRAEDSSYYVKNGIYAIKLYKRNLDSHNSVQVRKFQSKKQELYPRSWL